LVVAELFQADKLADELENEYPQIWWWDQTYYV